MRLLSLFIAVLMSLTLPCLKAQAQEMVQFITVDQDFQQPADPDNLKQDLLQYLLHQEINLVRQKSFAGTMSPENALNESAIFQAELMRDEALNKAEDFKDLNEVLEERGCNTNYNVLAGRFNLKKDGNPISYAALAQDVVAYWMNNPKTQSILLNESDRYIGIGVELSLDAKRVHIVVLKGSYNTYNKDLDYSTLNLEPSRKLMGLSPYDEIFCKKINKLPVHKIQESIRLEGESLYLISDDIKLIKKIIKMDTKDGIAVDLVQKDQYPADGDNLINPSMPVRGYLTKPIFANDLYANNEIEGKEARKQLRVYLGEVPYEIGAYEINAVIVKENCICRTLQPTFLPQAGFTPYVEIEYLADTINLDSKINFVPESVDDEHLFKIPVTDNKVALSYEELLPYLKGFDVPPYIVNKLSIAAFNSCDRSENRDMIQLHKKAEEIVKAFQTQQTEKIKFDIVTSNGWTLMRDDVIGTKYESLAFLDQRQAIGSLGPYLKDTAFQAIMARHRFAQVQMYVSYDIRGSREQDYAIYHFNKAIEKNNLPLALAIQKFIMKNIMSGKYNEGAIINQKIPMKPDLAGLIMNKLWLQKTRQLIDDEQFHNGLVKLYELDPNNGYIRFNYFNSEINFTGIIAEGQIFKIQSGIDKLYKSSISKPTVDALNLDFQFKLIRSLDTLKTTSDYLTPALSTVKTLANINATDENSALQLAYLFIRYDDYSYAKQLLLPYLGNENPNEEIIFTYLSLATFITNEYLTENYEKAFNRANTMNNTRLKKLMDEGKLSITLADNPVVKAIMAKW